MKNPMIKRAAELLKKYRYPALILALGALLMLIPVPGRGDSEQTAEPVSGTETDFDLEWFTRQAEQALSGLQGAGTVKLLLTLEDDGRQDYLMEGTQTHDGESGQSQTQAVLAGQSGGQTPVRVSRSYPRFRGAVALCPGGDSPAVVLGIKEALSGLTGLGMDKITVLKSD